MLLLLKFRTGKSLTEPPLRRPFFPHFFFMLLLNFFDFFSSGFQTFSYSDLSPVLYDATQTSIHVHPSNSMISHPVFHLLFYATRSLLQSFFRPSLP
jgi:hypothetical protein